MILSYRTRRFLRRLFTAALTLLLIAMVVWIGWVIWLERFIVYTDDGAILDFGISLEFPDGEIATAPQTPSTIPIHINDGSEEESGELPQLAGYYVEPELLLSDMAAVKQQLDALPLGTPVLIDVKNIRGGFYYTSAVEGATQASNPNNTAMDELLEYLDSKNLYTIARLPAFKDYSYGLANPTYGLPASVNGKNAGYLWMDDDRCYWLDPADNGIMTYLIQILKELQNKGFDEVVFTDFCYPDTESVYFNSDSTKEEVIYNAAQSLVTACATDSFCVSFVGTADFTLPIGRSRLYMDGVAAADAATLAELTGMENPQITLVFLTTVNDTRFDDYSVLRPLSGAYFDE